MLHGNFPGSPLFDVAILVAVFVFVASGLVDVVLFAMICRAQLQQE